MHVFLTVSKMLGITKLKFVNPQTKSSTAPTGSSSEVKAQLSGRRSDFVLNRNCMPKHSSVCREDNLHEVVENSDLENGC